MKKKKDFFGFLKDNYLKSWSYLKKSKDFILIIVSLFILFSFIGFFVPVPEGLTQQLMEYLREILSKAEGLNFLELFWFIFFNNFKVSFTGMMAGVLLGIFPILQAVANGYVLGFVSFTSVKIQGIFSLWKILPHGVFELPAVLIALGLGMRLGFLVFFKNFKKNFKEGLVESVRAFIFVVFPLLLLAALIESLLIILLKSV